MPIEKIYTVCPHDCPDTCGMITEVENGQAVNLYADPDHPITQGWLCAKVQPYLDHVYHAERLQHPLRRIGPKGSGQWERITWTETITFIATRWQAIIDQYGAEAILPYSYSGTLGLVQMYASSTRLWNRMGASRLERSICGEAGGMAMRMTIGEKWSVPYHNVRHSQTILIWGHNPVSTAPHYMPYLTQAQRQGCEVIVIDPRRTRTARRADWHIAPLPGSDGALALALGHIIVTEGLHDEAWLQAHTVGWPQLRDRLAEYPPARVAEITGLAESEIVELARRYARQKPSMIKVADGLQRHRNGGQTVRAICALPALTAQYGKRGGGFGYSAGGYVNWDLEALNHWSECPPPQRLVNMNRLGAALTGEVTDPPIKSLFVFGANPVAVSPNAGLITQGMLRDDLFTVVHELFMTDTAELADIILPATSQLEQDDLHKPYGNPVLAYNQQAIAPLNECKSNWEVMRLLAEAMGYPEPWLYQTPNDVIEEILTATAKDHPALQGVTLPRLQAEGQVHLHPDIVPFAGERFPTPSGKVELYSQTMADLGLDPLPNWVAATDEDAVPAEIPRAQGTQPPDSLTLLTGAAHHFVTSSFANHENFVRREGTPYVEINPKDAASRDINDGDLVKVFNRRGWCKLRAVVTDRVRPGVLASPKGRWRKHDPFQNGEGGRNVNWTTPDALGDLAGQSTFHTNWVWLARV